MTGARPLSFAAGANDIPEIDGPIEGFDEMTEDDALTEQGEEETTRTLEVEVVDEEEAVYEL